MMVLKNRHRRRHFRHCEQANVLAPLDDVAVVAVVAAVAVVAVAVNRCTATNHCKIGSDCTTAG